MEGTGLFAAAEHARVPWALAKAVCDFGHGKTKEHQPLAAAAAASLIAHVLKDPAMLDGLPTASLTEGVNRIPDTETNKDIAVDLLTIDSERFRRLCFYLARKEFGFATKFHQLPDRDTIRVPYVPHNATTAASATLICKAGAQSNEELLPSIKASLNAWPDYLPPPDNWILGIATKSSTELHTWFEAELRQRQGRPDIWDTTRLHALLKKHRAILEVFFYRSSSDVRRRLIVGDLELYELSLDLGRGWYQGDTGVLALSRATAGPADLVLDLIVRNRGEHEEVLTSVVAAVEDTRPVAHGYGGASLLHRPENPYRLSLGHGTPGRYSTVCEPRLAIQRHRSGRVAVRLIDTGYSWTGFVRVDLVFGEQTLSLPHIHLWT